MARRARGRVKAVVEKVVGDTLVVDLPAGSNEVEVEDAYVFDDVAGGMLRLGDEVLQYVEVDDDRSVVVLATGTEVEHVVGEEVVVLPETTEKTALVSVGDETDVEVRVTALWHLMLPAGIRDEADQERVLLRYEADEYTLEDVWAAPKQLPGEVIFGPLPNAEIPLPDLTELYEQLDALAIELDAVLPITATKITDGAIETSKLAANAVTAAKIAAEAVTAEKLFVDQAMVVKLVAKMIEVEALNAQVITGIQIVGGSISIAQGVASTVDQNFETASGATAPSGFTRLAGGTYSPTDLTFPASSGNPGRSAQVRIAAGTNADVWRILHRDTTAQDVLVAFDYFWNGTTTTGIDLASVGLFLRAPTSTLASGFATGPFIDLRDGNLRLGDINPGSGTGTLGQVAPNTWVRVEALLRGSSLSARLVVGGTPGPWVRGVASSSNISGHVAFASRTLSSPSTPTQIDQTHRIDNLHIEVLQTGLNVAPDGKTSVEYLTVNQAAVVPDPILPTDAVNFRTMNTADAVIAASVAALNGNPIAFPLNPGYSMHTFGSRPYYRRVSKDFVKVGGVITKSSGNFGTSFEDIGQLPAGFRCDTGDSQNQQFFMLGATAATTFGRARVADNGTISVQASASASYLPIDGILIDLRATRAAL